MASSKKTTRSQPKTEKYGPGCPIWMGRLFGSAIMCDRFIVLAMASMFLAIATFLIFYTAFATVMMI